ncbi:uncharacterized protein B4U79_13265 [Dinothrombium tinctorium]|uniref:3'-5' exonuclease domain-containing protein n=1 Tax=Dinothrombium tinctorium TaxID=1965070 RepID=A0A3S3QYF0_9ACAR|nr:uncharacterized protein B4U79_13265 [Dinothrombium tinctorium]
MEEDYEHIRNMTLMFFLDRLMDKGQPRNLHDLSCQFGTKGFTKEMRRIAGGSQSGLRKFLSQYPFLFTIENDQVFGAHSTAVYITNISNKDNPQAAKRDYNREAVEYFKQKLEQYGNAEVPIRSLLGHRSQATPEIRHIAGQHPNEFKEFLVKNSHVFVVKDDYVLLKSVLENAGANGEQLAITRVPEEVSIDPYLMKRLVFLLEQIILKLCTDKKEVTLDEVFNYLKCNYAEDCGAKLVSSSKDLCTVLKMNSKLFHVQSNLVSLTADREKQLVNGQCINEPISVQSPSVSPCSSASPISSPSRVTSSSASSFQQRIKSQIIKAISDNSFTRSRNTGRLSSIETLILQQTQVVSKLKECEEIVSSITKNKSVIAVDCEGVNLNASGTLTLLQVAVMPSDKSSSANVYIFDLLLNPDFVSKSLKQLLESDDIIKVMHDCRVASSVLFFQYGIQLRNVFDTQVAHSVLQQQNYCNPTYKAKLVSLDSLCETYAGFTRNLRKDFLKKIYKRDQKFWNHRPLTEEMICFAAHDVFSLIPTIYLTMKNAVKEEYLPLLKQLNEEAILAKIKPQEVKANKKLRKVEMEVTDLKHKLFNSEAKQIVLSNREIRLLRYIDLTDEIRSKIEGSQKVAKKLERLTKKQAAGGDCNDNNNGDYFSDDESESEEEYPSCSSNNSREVVNGNNDYTLSPSDSIQSTKSCCCSCHNNSAESVQKQTIDESVQTLSTGDIVITKVFCSDKI